MVYCSLLGRPFHFWHTSCPYPKPRSNMLQNLGSPAGTIRSLRRLERRSGESRGVQGPELGSLFSVAWKLGSSTLNSLAVGHGGLAVRDGNGAAEPALQQRLAELEKDPGAADICFQNRHQDQWGGQEHATYATSTYCQRQLACL